MSRGLPANYIKQARRELGAGANQSQVLKRAWEIYKSGKLYKKVYKGRKTKSSTVRKVSRRRRYTRSRKRRKKPKMPITVLAGLVGGAFIPSGYGHGSFAQYVKEGNFEEAGKALITGWTGISGWSGTPPPNMVSWINPFDFSVAPWLKSTIVGLLAHKVVSMIGGRQLSRYFDKIPWIGKYLTV